MYIKYHYLEDNKTELGVIGNYNIIVTNSQKIILKTNRKNNLSLLNNINYLEKKEVENERLRALRELNNLIVFVDEAHHAYGATLEGDLKKVKQTINYLHREGKTELVGMINLTGTPYIKGKILDEVVYYFGLKEGIEKGILKEVDILNYGNVKTQGFIKDVLQVFFDKYKDIKLDGKLPKIAFYAPTIEDLQNELRPMIEKALISKKINPNIILEYHTKEEKSKEEFLKLDTIESDKQIILLVGKGTEGWNCRSLTATALFRKPKSSVFVLQSTTRCLRAIGDNSTKATIFLSDENYKVLDKELKNNFDMGISDLNSQDQETTEHTIKVIKPKKIKVRRKIREIVTVKKRNLKNINIDLKSFRDESMFIQESGIYLDGEEAEYRQQKIREFKENRDLTYYEIVEKINRYTHLDYLEIKAILNSNELLKRGALLRAVNNNYNILGFIINEILNKFFDYEIKEKIYEEYIELTKFFSFKINLDSRKNKLVVYKNDKHGRLGFHIDPYNFDSEDEKDIFLYLSRELEPDEAIVDIYFTGGVTNPLKNEFYFDYYSPDHKKILKYFPDFLVETTKERYLVIEIKGQDKKTDYEANKKRYNGNKKDLFNEVFSKELGVNEFRELNKEFDYKIVFNAKLQEQQQELLSLIRQR